MPDIDPRPRHRLARINIYNQQIQPHLQALLLLPNIGAHQLLAYIYTFISIPRRPSMGGLQNGPSCARCQRCCTSGRGNGPPTAASGARTQIPALGFAFVTGVRPSSSARRARRPGEFVWASSSAEQRSRARRAWVPWAMALGEVLCVWAREERRSSRMGVRMGNFMVADGKALFEFCWYL